MPSKISVPAVAHVVWWLYTGEADLQKEIVKFSQDKGWREVRRVRHDGTLKLSLRNFSGSSKVVEPGGVVYLTNEGEPGHMTISDFHVLFNVLGKI